VQPFLKTKQARLLSSLNQTREGDVQPRMSQLGLERRIRLKREESVVL
jgi:hypothetical protein